MFSLIVSKRVCLERKTRKRFIKIVLPDINEECFDDTKDISDFLADVATILRKNLKLFSIYIVTPLYAEVKLKSSDAKIS